MIARKVVFANLQRPCLNAAAIAKKFCGREIDGPPFQKSPNAASENMRLLCVHAVYQPQSERKLAIGFATIAWMVTLDNVPPESHTRFISADKTQQVMLFIQTHAQCANNCQGPELGSERPMIASDVRFSCDSIEKAVTTQFLRQQLLRLDEDELQRAITSNGDPFQSNDPRKLVTIFLRWTQLCSLIWSPLMAAAATFCPASAISQRWCC